MDLEVLVGKESVFWKDLGRWQSLSCNWM